MKHKNFLKCGLLAFLLMAMAVIAVADPVWATIIDADLEGRYSYFIDKNGDGIEDGLLEINPGSTTSSSFRRYLQVGGRVLYENDGRDDFRITGRQLLRIEMPDGRLIKVNDFAGQYFEYQRARDYEASQTAQEDGR